MKSSELKLGDVLVRFIGGQKLQVVVNGLSGEDVYFENYPRPTRLFSQSRRTFEKTKWTKLGNISKG